MPVDQAGRKRKADQAVDLKDDELLEKLRSVGWPVDGPACGKEDEVLSTRLQTSIVLPSNVLIHCPPLSPTRPYPSLLARYLYNSPSGSKTSHRDPSRIKSYPLPLPSAITLVPYNYGRPTLLSRSHDPRYLLVFWPRLSDKLSSRLSQLSSAAAARSTGPFGGSSNLARPDASPESNFLQDESLAYDQGGVLALYTRPAPSTRKVTYFFTYDVHSYWTTDYNPITCRWLFEPRQWDVKTIPAGLKVEAEVDMNEMSVDGEEHLVENGHASSQPNGLPNGNGSEREETNVKFFRNPFSGPKPVVNRSKESSPLGFVVLFANHRLNFYSALHALPLVNNGMGLHGDDIPLPNYPKLEVLSCPLLTPSTVMPQPTSPLNLDGARESADASGSRNGRTTRLILPGQASIDIRPGDETIWVGFRSYRPHSVREQLEAAVAKTYPNDDVASSSQGARNGPIDLLPGMLGEVRNVPTRRLGNPPRSVFRASDKEGQEEDWVDVVEVRLDLQEDVFSVNARPIPRIRFPDDDAETLVNSGFCLTGITFTDPLDDRPRFSGEASVDGETEIPDRMSDPERALGLVLALSVSGGKKRRKTSLVEYKLSKRNVPLSDAFASLGSPTLPAKKLDLAGLGRAEWITHQTRMEDFEGRLTLIDTLPRRICRSILALGEIESNQLGDRERILSRLDLDTFKQGGSLFRTSETMAELSISPDGNHLLWTARGKARVRVDKLDLNPTRCANEVAKICVAILNGDAERDSIATVSHGSMGRPGDIDDLLTDVWKRLCGLSGSSSPSMTHVASFLRVQYGLLRDIHDDRAHSALFLLECVRALQLFTSSYRSVESKMKREGDSRSRQHSYDISAFWLLLSHMKWYLALIRAIMREAILAESGRLPGADHASPLHFMINPVSRRILRDLHYHVQAFAIFGTRCNTPLPAHPALGQSGQVDLASTQLAQADLREAFAATGIGIGALSKIYDTFEELTLTEAREVPPHEWMNSLFLAYTLPDTAEGLEAQIITHLTTNQKIIQHQASLFAHETGTIELGSKRYDIITKEALPASTTIAQRQYRQIRECTQCANRSAIWQMHPTADGLLPAGVIPAISETDDVAAKWHQRWQITCICGGLWRPVV